MAFNGFAGRDETSAPELGAELVIKRRNVPHDGYGNTCLVYVRRKCDVGFASSLTWLGVVGLCTERWEVEFLSVFIWVVNRKRTLRRPVARCVDLLTYGMVVLFVVRVTNL